MVEYDTICIGAFEFEQVKQIGFDEINLLKVRSLKSNLRLWFGWSVF